MEDKQTTKTRAADWTGAKERDKLLLLLLGWMFSFFVVYLIAVARGWEAQTWKAIGSAN